MYLFNKVKAFSFAELAIVMLIIGIVSMLTVPALKKYTQRATFERGAQKAYFTFNEAFDQAVVNHGSPHKWGDKAQSYVEESLKVDKNTGLTRDGMELVVSCTSGGCDFTADINGPKKEPNLEGKDIFEYKVTFAKIEKEGASDAEKNPVDEETGIALTDKVLPQGDAEELMKNNWKFTDELWDK